MQKKKFVQTIWGFYTANGRHDLPWRKTTDPYKIAVSEIMLQQTQVSRVLEKYKEFLKEFPTVQTLAKAPLQKVLATWSGLGYNRRAKFLKQMAEIVVKEYNGKFPKSVEQLKTLPGIGPYTASAIAAFAYNMASVCIETNIRTIYLHHFFADRNDVSDKEILEIIEATLDQQNPREWYWALMDYGSYLKSSGIRNNTASKHYNKQAKFEGSRRQIRGKILKLLIGSPKTKSQIKVSVGGDKETIDSVLEDLVLENLITKEKGIYGL